MDRISENNSVLLRGTAAGQALYSHSSRGLDFWRFPLAVRRLSGNTDTLNVIVRREQLETLEAAQTGKLLVGGELRSFNNRRGDGAKLVITVFARTLAQEEGEDENLVALRGTLCKAPNLRQTPLGRDICDLMLAVNRRCGRSDYLPCICWGAAARQAGLWGVGTRISLSGRIQSRRYVKITEAGPVERTAFEVSITEAEPLTGELSSAPPV